MHGRALRFVLEATFLFFNFLLLFFWMSRWMIMKGHRIPDTRSGVWRGIVVSWETLGASRCIRRACSDLMYIIAKVVIIDRWKREASFLRETEFR